ncbi:hypothetical protein AAHE18_03G211100 [Arachis hypogaea]
MKMDPKCHVAINIDCGEICFRRLLPMFPVELFEFTLFKLMLRLFLLFSALSCSLFLLLGVVLVLDLLDIRFVTSITPSSLSTTSVRTFIAGVPAPKGLSLLTNGLKDRDGFTMGLTSCPSGMINGGEIDLVFWTSSSFSFLD